MIHVIVVNGQPRAGKDTFIEMVTSSLQSRGVHVDSFSSIDPVRDMLSGAGFNLRRKTEADRKLLAVVGAAMEEHSSWRTSRCIDEIRFFKFTRFNGVFFLHVREPAIISNIRLNLPSETKLSTVFIESTRAEDVTSNAADAGVRGMTYDLTIHNNGTLDDLRRVAEEYAMALAVKL